MEYIGVCALVLTCLALLGDNLRLSRLTRVATEAHTEAQEYIKTLEAEVELLARRSRVK